MYSVLVGGQLSLIPTSDKAHFLAARFFLAFIWADIYHSPPHWVVKPRVNCALPHLHIYTSLTEGWGRWGWDWETENEELFTFPIRYPSFKSKSVRYSLAVQSKKRKYFFFLELSQMILKCTLHFCEVGCPWKDRAKCSSDVLVLGQ